MNGKMWVLSRGAYSDYGVEAGFATKELAEATAARLNALPAPYHEPYGVEEYCFYTEPPELVSWWTATATRADKQSPWQMSLRCEVLPPWEPWEENVWRGYRPIGVESCWISRSTDREKAIENLRNAVEEKP